MSLPDPQIPVILKNKPKNNPRLSILDLFRRLGPWRNQFSYVLLCLMLAALSAALEAVAPAVLGYLIDQLIIQPNIPWLLAIGYILALLFAVGVDRWSDWYEISVASRISSQVYMRLFSDHLNQPDEAKDFKHATHESSRLQQASMAAGDVFRSGLVGPIRIALSIVSTAIMAYLINPTLAFISLFWAVLLVVSSILIAPKTGELSDQEQKLKSKLISHAADIFLKKNDVQRVHAQNYEMGRSSDLIDHWRKSIVARARYSEWRLWIIGALQASYVGTVLLVSLWQWKNGQATPGDVAAIVGLALALMDNLQWAGQQVYIALSSHGVLSSVVAQWAPPSRRLVLPEQWDEVLPPINSRLPDTLSLKKIRYKTLREISFDIEPGEHTLILGPVDMREHIVDILEGRGQPESGSMGWGNADFSPHSDEQDRDEVVVIPPHPRLMERTLEENIWLGKPPQNKPHWVSDWLGIQDKWPEGYLSYVGQLSERPVGTMMRVRVLIAQALIDPPSLLVIEDLPDTSEAQKMMSELKDILPQMTTVVITSRKSTSIDWIQSVVIVGQGKILEEGHPVDLLTHGRHYQHFKRGGT